LAQDVLLEDLSHHVSGVAHLHEMMNHHVPEDPHDDAASLVLMVCVAHLQKDGAHQSELDAPLALNFELDVKDGMGVVLYCPSFLSPSRFLIV
jgi:hypothetical protein